VTTYEMLREGEWTTDGRLLTTGTVSWDDEKIPLMERDLQDAYESHIVGFVYNIRRVGDRILGDTDYEVGKDMTLVCDCDRIGITTEHEELGVEFNGARIRAAVVIEKDRYPWKNDEEEGGEAG
jgi:hypothetical protein